MSNANFIAELLQIKDPNISFSKKVSSVVKHNITYKLIFGKLSYTPEACPCCGCLNDSSIIKHGTKTSDIKLLPCNGSPTMLRLTKQRFLCKNCNSTFSAKTKLVDKNCYISKQVKTKILETLSLKISEKDIAYMNYVSASTVSRSIDNCFPDFKPNRRYLPKHLLFDEFKSTKDSKGSMSFIYVNADTHEIIDIVENRQLHYLKRYFSKFSKSARGSVRTVCMDMYSPYMSLVKDLFPNAEIIIDKFHIVQMLSRSLNKCRVKTMSQFSTHTMEYKRLKRYWKLILKDEAEIDDVYFNHVVHFKNWVSNKTIVTTSIAVNPVLENTYEAYQTLLKDIQAKDSKTLKHDLLYYLNSEISEDMKKSIETLLKHYKYIENSLKYDYTNGTIEGLNNYIKVLKRIAFGYKSFVHFRSRILISQRLIKPTKKYKVA